MGERADEVLRWAKYGKLVICALGFDNDSYYLPANTTFIVQLPFQNHSGVYVFGDSYGDKGNFIVKDTTAEYTTTGASPSRYHDMTFVYLTES